MALVVKDRVKETTTTTGTGTYTLDGAVQGFQSFGVIGDGNTTYYAVTNGTDWEVGVGTYTASGTTLARTSILESSNAGSAVNWSAGPKDIFVTYPAERAVYLSAAGSAVDVLDIGTLGTSTANITTANITAGTVSTTPTSNTDLVNKLYVDNLVAAGIHFHTPVRVESPINLNATYNNGTSGVGATLTNAGTQAALVIDGVTVSVNDRVLVYQQTTQTQNGIYVVSDVGSGSTNWVLTRATDADSYVIDSPNGLSEGSTVFVQEGTTGAGETYTCNTTGTITFGTTNITFVQISSAQIYSAGTGLTLSGTQFSLSNVGTAATYGSASQVPVFTTNAQGQITTVTNTSIAIPGSAITSGTVAVVNGGTGQSSYTDGQLLIGNSTGNTLAKATLTAGTGISVTNGPGSITVAATNNGTVTSVDVSGGTTGLTTSGGPVTSSGTITLAGTLAVANGGTGQTTYTNGQLLIGNTTGNTLAKATLTAGTGISITNGAGSITVAATNNGTVTSVGGTGTVNGITLTGTVTSSGNLTLGGTLSGVSLSTQVTGTLPLGNGGTGQTTAQAAINSLAGAVTSGQYLRGNGTNVVMSAIQAADVPTLNQNTTGSAATLTTARTIQTNLASTSAASFNGSANITPGVTGTLPIANGGTGLTTTPTNGQIDIGNGTGFTRATLTASTGISITNGAGSITIAATNNGTVTSVSGTGSVNGITLSGTVTSSGSLTLGGSLSNVSLTTQVTGTLPVANGGTGVTTSTGTTAVVLSTTPVITGLREKSAAVAASNIDLSLGNYFTRTISGATTFTASNVATSGDVAAFILVLTNGGSAAITWFSGTTWAGGSAPSLTSSGVDILGFFTINGGTTWRGLVLAKDIK